MCLRHIANVARKRAVRPVSRGLPLHQHLPGQRRQHTQQRAQQGSFAATVGAQQAQHFGAPQSEVLASYNRAP